MAVLRLSQLTWTQVEKLNRERLVALLPVGALEAHGPHLPLSTDGIIAESMAAAAAVRLEEEALVPLLLPPLEYTAAPFAAGFPGTLSIRPETVAQLIADIALGLAEWGVPVLGIANAHLDPTHLASLVQAVEKIRETRRIQVAFPDLTRKPWGSRLTDEFKSGACHAGRFESSIVMAAHPEWVQEKARTGLAPNSVSLSAAIRQGISSFAEAGGDQAYFGDPAAASAAEGKQTIEVLGDILADAILGESDYSNPGPDGATSG
jgi:creatinine amidohydrolase